MVDVARLARALDPEGATEAHAVHGTAARHASLHCVACGAPLPAGVAAQCGHCGATLAVGQLGQAHAAVKVLESALRAHEQSPAPHVRKRRLEGLDADLPRRREWARQMEAEAGDMSAQSGGDEDFWGDLRERPVTVVVLGALLAWFLWKLWG